jgi:hypothetical protein
VFERARVFERALVLERFRDNPGLGRLDSSLISLLPAKTLFSGTFRDTVGTFCDTVPTPRAIRAAERYDPV